MALPLNFFINDILVIYNTFPTSINEFYLNLHIVAPVQSPTSIIKQTYPLNFILLNIDRTFTIHENLTFLPILLLLTSNMSIILTGRDSFRLRPNLNKFALEGYFWLISTFKICLFVINL